jgi:hypothetical protein
VRTAVVGARLALAVAACLVIAAGNTGPLADLNALGDRIAACTLVIDANPPPAKLMPALVVRGQSLLDKRQCDEAIADLDRARTIAPATRGFSRGLARANVQGASLVVYAAKHGQTALNGDGEDSPFAVAVMQRIATPGVEINKLFRLVRDDVMEATAGRQEPYTCGSLPGKEDFFFVSK